MFTRVIKMLLRMILFMLILGSLVVILPRLITGLFAWPRLYLAENVPAQRVAIVFGAGLRRDGSPSPVLRNRVEAAAKLYFAGKVEKLLMSGDNRFVYYNEPGAMSSYALELGIPQDAIVLDYAGRSTYDTCYRARDIFKVPQAILITQGFHLPRALYLCNTLGVSSVGVASDLRQYRPYSLLFWNLRELLATMNAMLEVHLTHPQPVLGIPEPIFPTEAQ